MAIFLGEPIVEYSQLWFDHVPSDVQILIAQTIIASIIIMIFGEVILKRFLDHKLIS